MATPPGRSAEERSNGRPRVGVATRLRRRGRTQCAWCCHLLVCGHRIYEVTTTTLGPLLLVRLPQSKPVTPMLSCQPDAEAPTTDRTSTTPEMPPRIQC